MIIDYAAIGLRIRKLRRQKYWTQEKLAEKAEIAPDYLCRIECGKKHPSLKTILLLADAMEITADDLLVDVQKRSTPVMGADKRSLLAGCTERQKRLVLTICRNLKDEMIKYDGT